MVMKAADPFVLLTELVIKTTILKRGIMVQRIVAITSMFALPFISSADFLDGVRAEDLSLDRIEQPSAEDTIGISDWSRYFNELERRPVSPNGRFVAEVRTKGRYADGIWITNLATGEDYQIDIYGMMPKWSSNDSLIAYLWHGPLLNVYDSRGHQLYGGDELYVCDRDGNNKTNLTSGLVCSGFQWSPDCQHIGFSYWDTLTGPKGGFNLGVVNVETRSIITIDKGAPYIDMSFSFSPNGNLIAYCQPIKWQLMTEWWPTDAELFVCNIDGTHKTQITRTEAVERMVKWLNDGKSLVVEQHGSDPSDFSLPRYVKIVLKTKD